MEKLPHWHKRRYVIESNFNDHILVLKKKKIFGQIEIKKLFYILLFLNVGILHIGFNLNLSLNGNKVLTCVLFFPISPRCKNQNNNDITCQYKKKMKEGKRENIGDLHYITVLTLHLYVNVIEKR